MKFNHLAMIGPSKNKWLHIRISINEHRLLMARLQKSTCRNMSQYIRNAVFDKPIVMTYRNVTQDALLIELSILNKQLNSIGNNLNQITKRLHTIRPQEIEDWGCQFSSQSGAIMLKVGELRQLMHRLSERWLR